MRRIIPLACVAAVASGIALTGWATSFLDGIEQESIDTRFDIRGERAARSDIAVVGFDDKTAIDLNQRWPLRRREQARFVDALRTYDPRLIVYDIQLTEATTEKDDFAIYDAISRARPVLLATTVFLKGGRTNVFGGDNADALRDAGATVGSALIRLDADGEVRRVDHATSGIETLSVSAASLIGHRVDPDDFPGWVDWHGPSGTVDTHSWSDVLAKKVPRRALAGKVVIVGVTAEVIHDVHNTSAPGPGQLSGAEIQADMLATILDDFPLGDSPGGLDVVLIVLLGCAVPLLAIRYSLHALLALPVLATVYLVAVQLAFDGGTILPVVWPVTGLVLSGTGTGLTLLFTEVLERRRLRRLFSRFVPAQAADEIIERADAEGKLRGEEIDATVLFVDLRGFTGFSEANAASVVIELLDRYLEEMGDAAHAHGGTIVVYMGDGMMAVFGAPVEQPDHARRALAAAQEMLHERLPKVNAWLRERGLDKQFEIVIGINSGPVMSGTVGSMKRLEYTAIGDTTNVAARLEGVAKELGEPLLMSQATRDRLGDMPGLEEVGETELRGRVTPERLWTFREPESIVEQMPA